MSSKRIKVTPEIDAMIKNSIDDQGIDTAKLAVYEARILTTEPLQKGGFYNKARFTKATLDAMAATLNSKGGALGIQVMHDMNELPTGKIFSGLVREMENGNSELLSMFYVLESNTDLIAKLDTSIIDEVSVGVLPAKALCSECGFDYFGEDADFTNLYTLTCNENHEIGANGVHVVASGLQSFMEVSLVSKGAAKNPKILSRAKQSLSQDNAMQIAASGAPLEARLFTMSHKFNNAKLNNGELKMEKELLALLDAKSTEIANVTVAITGLKASVAEKDSTIETLKASLTEKETEITALKAASEDAVTLAASVEESKANEKKVIEMLLPHAKAALIASGVAEAELPTNMVALVAAIEEKGLKLHQIFVESKSDAKKDDVKVQLSSDYRNEAFKTKK